MTTETVDITDKKIGSKKEYVSRLNDTIVLDSKKDSTNNYYYSIGSFNFVLGQGFKPETLENINLTAVPFLPDWYLGIVSIHGLIIPVIDIVRFGNSQKLRLKSNNTNKSYLLKLEHKDFSPVVFKLNNLPQLVNTDSFTINKTKDQSIDWIKHYLEKDDTSIAIIDHKKLFDQMIDSQ